MSQDLSITEFKTRAQTTQVVYQTLLQQLARQAETDRGVSSIDAELLHALATAAAATTSGNLTERKNAWQAILSTANLAINLITEEIQYSTVPVANTPESRNIPYQHNVKQTE